MGLYAFGRGKRVVCMEGWNVYEALDRNLPIDLVLERKVRHAAETGEPFARTSILFPPLAARSQECSNFGGTASTCRTLHCDSETSLVGTWTDLRTRGLPGAVIACSQQGSRSRRAQNLAGGFPPIRMTINYAVG